MIRKSLSDSNQGLRSYLIKQRLLKIRGVHCVALMTVSIKVGMNARKSPFGQTIGRTGSEFSTISDRSAGDLTSQSRNLLNQAFNRRTDDTLQALWNLAQ